MAGLAPQPNLDEVLLATAFALVIAFGFALEWVFILLGLLARTGHAAQRMGMGRVPEANPRSS
jgi:hypothetical protein